MIKRLVIEYDVVNQTIAIPAHEFTPLEVFALLHATLQLTSADWLGILEVLDE